METESSKIITVNGKTIKAVKVRSVTDLSKHKVYDFEVAGTHNYYAGGMNVHNCGYHDMLKHEGNRNGEELLKFQTQMLHYPHRQLMLYPAGPNRKLLRGKTRWLCIRGDALVQTDLGLIEMQRIIPDQNRVCVAGAPATVLRAMRTGAKKLIRLTTTFGFSLDLTPAHLVMCSDEHNDMVWRQAQHIKPSDVVIVAGANGASRKNLDQFRKKDGTRHRMTSELASQLADDEYAESEWGFPRGEVPWVILRSSLIHVSAYLSALFQDSFVLFGEDKRMQQTQILLLSLGVLSVRRPSTLQIHRNSTTAFRVLLDNPFDYQVRDNNHIVRDRLWRSEELEGEHDVYDIEVEDIHMFSANGILVHNCLLDEWAFFSDGNEEDQTVRMNGSEVYTSLDNSMLNVRVGWKDRVKSGYYDVPNAVFIIGSSPQHRRDVMMRHVKSNANSRKILALHLATWDIHPKLSRKALDSYFQSSEAKAMRDFGAQPPLVDSAFIQDHDAISALPGKVPNRVVYNYHKVERHGVKYRYAKVACNPPALVISSVMTIDAGLSNNSFTCTISHRNPNRRDPIKVITDVMLEIAPSIGNSVVNFSLVYEHVLLPLAKAFNVCYVFADQWNSIKLLHDLSQALGIPAERYSLKRDDMLLVQNHILDRSFRIPASGIPLQEILLMQDNYPQCFQYLPVEHFLLQLATIRDGGRTIEKAPGLTDDIWRAWALGTKFLLDDEWCKKHIKPPRQRGISAGIGAGSSTMGIAVPTASGLRFSSNPVPSNIGSIGGGPASNPAGLGAASK